MSFHSELALVAERDNRTENVEVLDAIINKAEALSQVSEETLAAMVEQTFSMVGELRDGLLAEAQKLASL